MPTIYTRTVGTASRQYSTNIAAEAAVPTIATSADLLANDEAVVFDNYNDSVFAGNLAVDGSLTTDATRNVTYRAASGEQHDGTSGTGVRWEPSGASAVVENNDDYTKFEGLSLSQNSSGDGRPIIATQFGATNAATGMVISKCLFDAGPATSAQGIHGANSTSVATSGNPVKVIDCVFRDFTGLFGYGLDIGRNVAGAHYWDVVNCTFYNCTQAIKYKIDHASSSMIVRLVNLLAVDACTDDWLIEGSATGTLTTTGSTNNFGENSQFPGLGTPDPIIGTTDTTPSPPNNDYAIYTSAADLTLFDGATNDVLDNGVGTTNSLVSATDILGNARGVTTCDPGAFQVTAVAASGAVDPSLLSASRRTHRNLIRQ